jgi:hypothetical protein
LKALESRVVLLIVDRTGPFKRDTQKVIFRAFISWIKLKSIAPAVENKRKRTSSGRDATGAIVNVRQRGGDAIERGIARRGTFWDYGNTGKGNTGSDVLEQTGHPARFPLRLARDVVACFSAPGALVCDPFLGSGTTAVACAQLGRAFMGGDAGHAPDGRPWAEVALECVGRDGQPRPIAVGGGEPEVAADEMIVALDAGAPPA